MNCANCKRPLPVLCDDCAEQEWRRLGKELKKKIRAFGEVKIEEAKNEQDTRQSNG